MARYIARVCRYLRLGKILHKSAMPSHITGNSHECNDRYTISKLCCFKLLN